MSKMLYRDPKNGKIGGVCAGLADYFGMETWLVRILAVSAFLIGFGFFVIVAYIAAMLILDKLPEEKAEQVKQKKQHQVKQKPWQSGKSANKLLDDLEGEFETMEKEVEKMEAYVTSTSYEVHRQFKQL